MRAGVQVGQCNRQKRTEFTVSKVFLKKCMTQFLHSVYLGGLVKVDVLGTDGTVALDSRRLLKSAVPSPTRSCTFEQRFYFWLVSQSRASPSDHSRVQRRAACQQREESWEGEYCKVDYIHRHAHVLGRLFKNFPGAPHHPSSYDATHRHERMQDRASLLCGTNQAASHTTAGAGVVRGGERVPPVTARQRGVLHGCRPYNIISD